MKNPELPGKSDRVLRHLAIAFALAIAGYAAFFSFDRHMRLRNGPWIITFEAAATSPPSITIFQKHLGISNVVLQFNGESNAPVRESVTFDRPKTAPAFGQLIFEDLTFLPGTLTFNFNDHIVELLPRTMIINTREHAWKPGELIVLEPSMKAGAKALPPKKRRR